MVSPPIFINSLENGLVPDSFRRAVVTPLIKKPNLEKNDLKNYRPGSGLGFVSKLLERVVCCQVKSHLDQNNLENSFQSAYKSGHSMENLYLKTPFYVRSIHKSKRHFDNSFSSDAPRLWNGLPDDMRTAPSLSTLKKN